MKKTLFLLLTLVIVSCKKEPQIDYAIISGTIQNAEKPEIKIYNQYSFDVEKEINLDKDGSFRDTLYIVSKNMFVLMGPKGAVEMYLKKGSKINITYDAKDFENTINITGNASNPSKYYLDRDKKTAEFITDRTEVFKKEEEVFKKIYLDLKQAEEDLLFNYEGLSNEFKTAEKRNIKYTYLGYLNNYERSHSYYSKKEDFKVSGNFLKEMNNVEYDNENDFLYSLSYRGLVSTKVSKDAMKMVEKDSTVARDIAMLKAASKIENPTIKNKLLYDEAKYGITYTNDLEDFYAVYKENSTDEKNNAKIEESYSSLKKLAEGNPSPEFRNYENYAGGTTSMEDLKGKYVYIDVWATWCGPCIAEIPSLKKVEKEFHGKDIQFLSISIDDKKDHDKWKEMIRDRELGGMQLMADNNWESKFITDYMIKGIPRFILLDKEGNIINANAPRPSDKKLVTVLNGLNL